MVYFKEHTHNAYYESLHHSQCFLTISTCTKHAMHGHSFTCVYMLLCKYIFMVVYSEL